MAATKSKTKASNKNTAAKGKNSKNSSVNNRNNKQPVKKGLSPRVKAILYIGIAVILLCLNFISGQYVWSALQSFMFGMFGVCSILLPALFVYLAVITTKEQRVAHMSIKVVLCVAILFFASSLIYMFSGEIYQTTQFLPTLAYLYEKSFSCDGLIYAGGGLLSGILGYPLVYGLGETAAIIVSLVVLVALIMIVTGISFSDIANVAQKRMQAVTGKVKERSEAYRRERETELETEEHEIEPAPTPKQNNSKNITKIDIPIDAPLKKTEKSENAGKVDISCEDDGSAVDPSASDDLLNIIRLANGEYDSAAKTKASMVAKEISKDKEVPITEKGAKQPNPQTVSVSAKSFEETSPEEEFSKEVSSNKEEKADNKKPSYVYPPVALLHPSYETDDKNAMNELQNNAAKLIETLKSFGVTASITNICRGPSVTRYELQPGPGVKISKITNLSDDIALNLAANGVRIEAPIPGKAAVGIEVPNKIVSMVSMRELIDSNEFKNGKSKLTSVLGKDISGNNIVADLAKMPHLLIAGTTGSGKSVCVNSILISILFKATPDEVKLLLIDPKMVEFSKYKGIPHLLVPVVSDAKKAAGALNWAVTEMLQRYKIFSEFDCKNIHGFNKLVNSNLKFIQENSTSEEEKCMEVNGLPVPKEKMPQIVIAIDELADLMMAAPNEVEESICRLAQMARAAGMHLIIATQRPSVNVITGVIKANIPSRISLKVSSNIDSRTILDFGGAEKLIGHGDMLFAPVGAPKPLRVQGCYASDEEIERVTGYIKKSYSTQYNIEIEEKIRKIAAEELNTGSKKESAPTIDGNDVDSKMEEAIKCVIEAGQASTSLIQRRIKVGYARAGRMIDDMEQMGIIGPHQGSKPREVLMTYQQWLERNNILGDDLSMPQPFDDDDDNE